MFGTAAVRERVLAAWAASPARFREDANAEEELVHGAYRDRVLVELAQNAADAAGKAREPGRLLLSLRGSTLVAANTGAGLDAAGVEALSTLRASAKRDDDGAVGRFGVGFAAVLAVTDEPSVVSHGHGVRWARTETLRELSHVAQLATEVERRGPAVPVLRLPFDAGGDVPEGYDTAVFLPLRDETAVEVVRQAMAAIDDALLLTLPALREIVTEFDGGRSVLTGSDPVVIDADRQVSQRSIGNRIWRLATRIVQLDPAALAERPSEERARLERTVSVAVPVEGDVPAPTPSSVPGVIHAPTPTDDRTALPVLVIADLPLDSSRRRVFPGQVAAGLVDQIAHAYGALVESFDHPAALRLVPGAMGAGEVDAQLHRAVLSVLADTEFVATIGADDHVVRTRPGDVTLIRGLDVGASGAVLGRVVSGLPARGWNQAAQLRRLGAREITLSDLIDELAALRLEPEEWADVYGALEVADVAELGALPVPLADGRLVRGVRGLLVAGEVGYETLRQFGLRVVAPGAEHPLLHRLGAVVATPAAVLDDPRTQAAVDAALETDGADQLDVVVDAVLALVAASGRTQEQLPWLGSLELPDAAGFLAPAHDLVLPGSPVLDLLENPDEFEVARDVAESHGRDVLLALGVRADLSVVREADVGLDDIDLDLDDLAGWLSAVAGHIGDVSDAPIVAEFSGIRDLDAFRGDMWTRVLGLLASEPSARAAVVRPVHVIRSDASRVSVPSYSAWWLGEHVRIDGLRLSEHSAADADPVLSSLLPRLPVALDAEFVAAVGLPRELEDVVSGTLVQRLAVPDVELDVGALARVYAELAARQDVVARPGKVRVPDGLSTRVVDAADALVVEAPYRLQLVSGPVIVGTDRLADMLGVAMARDVHDAGVVSSGTVVPVPASVRPVLPEAPGSYTEHDDLRVGGVAVDWWVQNDTVHAATVEGIARGLAWVSDAWDRRRLVADVLRDPASVDAELLEEQFPP